MPYKSEKQRRWAHTPAGTKVLGGKKKVEEWDRASKGMKLPERAGKALAEAAMSASRRGKKA